MAAFYFLAVFTVFPLVSSSEEIKVKPGDDVTLQCQSPRDEAIRLLEWIRPDLKTDDYVFFFRENRPYENYQHSSFSGRVQLSDPEMKDGDVSVTLKNVDINDTGTYECRVSVKSKGLKLMTTINLKVEDSGHTAGNTWTEGDEDGGDKDEGHKDGGDKDEGDKDGGDEDGNMRGHVGLTVGGVLFVIVGLFLFIKCKPKKQNSYQSPAETSDVHQL